MKTLISVTKVIFDVDVDPWIFIIITLLILAPLSWIRQIERFQDFYVFADKRGGVWVQRADKVKERAEEWERLHPKQNETEEVEAGTEKAEEAGEVKDEEDDDLDDF